MEIYITDTTGKDIKKWYNSIKKNQTKIIKCILNDINNISENPKIGKLYNKKYRKTMNLKTHIFYKIMKEKIYIMSISILE